MERFSIEKYLANPEQKVTTKWGVPVRILCTDGPDKSHPIVGFIEGETEIHTWSPEGIWSDMTPDSYDLALSGDIEHNEPCEVEEEHVSGNDSKKWTAEDDQYVDIIRTILMMNDMPYPGRAADFNTPKHIDWLLSLAGRFRTLQSGGLYDAGYQEGIRLVLSRVANWLEYNVFSNVIEQIRNTANQKEPIEIKK